MILKDLNLRPLTAKFDRAGFDSSIEDLGGRINTSVGFVMVISVAGFRSSLPGASNWTTVQGGIGAADSA